MHIRSFLLSPIFLSSLLSPVCTPIAAAIFTIPKEVTCFSISTTSTFLFTAFIHLVVSRTKASGGCPSEVMATNFGVIEGTASLHCPKYFQGIVQGNAFKEVVHRSTIGTRSKHVKPNGAGSASMGCTQREPIAHRPPHLLPLTFPIMDNYWVTGELSRGDECPNGFLDRPQCLGFLQENVL